MKYNNFLPKQVYEIFSSINELTFDSNQTFIIIGRDLYIFCCLMTLLRQALLFD